jgi:TrmH family RNA methyltransferase
LKKITSTQHPLVKHLVKLRENRDYREQNGSVMVSGYTVVKELTARFKPHCLLVTGSSLHPQATHIVSEAIIEKITRLPQPEGIVAEFPLPKPRSLIGKSRILAVENLTDPGNLGTLVRSALAFDFEGIFLIEPSVDLFNDKTIRAARGYNFLLPFCSGTLDDLKEVIEKNKHTVLIADTKGKSIKKVTNPLLILANETRGPSASLLALGETVTIATKHVESLNAAIAGSILLYALS